MPSLYEILRQDPEAVPDWLETFQAGETFDRANFFSSRVVYYLGSGTDGRIQ